MAVTDLLNGFFSSSAMAHIEAAVAHYVAMYENYQKTDWEKSILKAGKFVEAILKALNVHAGKTLPPPRKFKVDSTIEDLRSTSLDDSLRLLVPRALRFFYDIASNRGARHDPSGIDANRMDATVLIDGCSWVLAELVRNASFGKLSTEEAKDIVSALMQKKFPAIENVDGRVWFHVDKPSARDIAILALWEVYPRRIGRKDLENIVLRHNFEKPNVQVSIKNLAQSRIVDNDGNDNFKLLVPGIHEAERVFADKKLRFLDN